MSPREPDELSIPRHECSQCEKLQVALFDLQVDNIRLQANLDYSRSRIKNLVVNSVIQVVCLAVIDLYLTWRLTR